jgi:Aldo/keto reductase family
VQEYAQRHEATAEAILLAWLLKHPAKIQPVLGTTSPNRLRACAKSLSVFLSREEWGIHFLPRLGEHQCLRTANNGRVRKAPQGTDSVRPAPIASCCVVPSKSCVLSALLLSSLKGLSPRLSPRRAENNQETSKRGWQN